MLGFKNHFKKIAAAAAVILTTSLIAVTPAKSDDDNSSNVYLRLITQYTYDTAQAAHVIEQSIVSILVLLNSWMLPDTSQTTATLQANFAQAVTTALNDVSTQTSLQQRLMQDFYGSSVTATTVPYVNDMTYSTLLGQPLLKPDPRQDQNVDGSYNYLKNVAGLNIQHVVPNMHWKGSNDNKIKYRNFYTTVSAIQTFNSYVLSQLYLNKASGKDNPLTLTEQQNQLVKQASNSDWFGEIASESIGTVLRQTLMYNSQLFVLMTQQLQTQKQLLATLAMTNTLIVIGDQFTENQLLNKATGATPE